jgi:hypothetical protein
MTHEVNRGYFDYVVNLKNKIGLYKNGTRLLLLPRLLLFPIILLYAVALWAALSATRRLSYQRRLNDDVLSRAEAMTAFVEQYPFHYYPILAKGYELMLLRDLMKQHQVDPSNLVEFAVGEASLSHRVFEGVQSAVIGCDLNPYSLLQCKKYAHFKALVVADVTDPPLVPGTVDCLLSMNFMHHVSQKREVLSRWSLVAERAIFNENTNFWASASCWSSLLRMLGLKQAAAQAAKAQELASHQSLLAEDEIDTMVSENYSILERFKFIDRSTMLLSNISSWFMIGVYGPPTPEVIKKISKPFRELAKAVTKELYLWDQSRDRKHDVFLLYFGKSIHFRRQEDEPHFVQPGKSGSFSLEQARQKNLPCKDGMVFLLADEHQSIFGAYDAKTRAEVAHQHL